MSCGAGGQARVEVRDVGPGVPEDHLDRIFEPFVRLDASSGRRGAGLGLTIARGIVEAHGGTVTARSEPGAGSTFTISLPPPGPRGDRA